MTGATGATVLFLPETMNLAETTRSIEVARASRGRWAPLFGGYGGPYAPTVEEAGFDLHLLEPRYDQAKVDLLYRVDRMETWRRPFSLDELDRRVRSELALYERVQPAAVFMGFDLTAYLSARIARIPLVVLLPFSATRPFFEAGLGGVPDQLRRGPLRALPGDRLDRWFRSWVLRTRALLGPFDALARRHGIEPFPTMLRSWEGDLTLVADVPEVTGVPELPAGWHHVGPVVARLPGEVPEQVRALDRDRPWVWCAFGSSGRQDVAARVLDGLGRLDAHVIAPVRHLLRGGVRVPPNVVVLDPVPAHLVNPLCDVAVIHGGHGTVQTALMSGTPFVGIGMQPEQEWNIDAIGRLGAAVRLPRHGLRPEAVAAGVLALLSDRRRRAAAHRLRDVYARWDGPATAADHLTRVAVG